MKFCPNCRNRYTDDIDFCLVDGAALRISDPDAETLRKYEGDDEREQHSIGSGRLLVKKGDTHAIGSDQWKIKVRLKDIFEAEFNDKREAAALLMFSGGRPFASPHLKKIHKNTYLVPRVSTMGEEKSVFFFQEVEEWVRFLRVFVEDVSMKSPEIRLAYRYLEWRTRFS